MNLATAATRIGNFRTFSISRGLNERPGSTDATIVRLVGRDQRVLELGSGAGHMSQALREQGCSITGIEINPEAAKSAAAHCERVIVGDLDYLNFERELGTDRFDIVLAADVLEHLKDPLQVLQAVKQFLVPHGHVVISIPNIAHISVRLALLAGRFPYSETGLLDQTHLRFLTHESLERLMEDADLAIGHFERITHVPGDPHHFEVPYDPAVIPSALLEEMLQDPEALTYQFVLSGYPLPQSGLVFIQDRIKRLAIEADTARAEANSIRLESQNIEAAKEAAVAERDKARLENETLQSELQLLRERTDALVSEKSEVDERLATGLQERERSDDEVGRLQGLYDESVRSFESLSEELRVVRGQLDERLATVLQERERSDDEIRRVQGLYDESLRSFECASEELRLVRDQLDERNLEVHDQNRRTLGLKTQVEILLNREKDLRDMLLEAHDQLLRRDEEIAVTLASAQAAAAHPASPQPASAPSVTAEASGGKYLAYQKLVQTIRQLVRSRVPDGGDVLVLSKGDDDLLRIEPCRGSHFPQREDGRYTGYYPADGVAAVEHLKQLRERGAQFFLVPQTAMWWLDHYAELRDYLAQYATRVIDQPDACILFQFAKVAERPIADQVAVVIQSSRSPRQFGVNISGNITSEKGVGEAVRGQTRSLMAAGVPVGLKNVVDDTAVNLVGEFTNFSEDNPYAANLIHLNADALLDFVEANENEYFQDHYNVGFWAWETSAFPRAWWDRFQHLDEIWVGSDFVLDAISRVSPIPVIKTPLAVNPASVFSYSRSHFGLPGKTYIFLFAFDYMSVVQRKNPVGLVRAFRKAFGPKDDVMLVLKCGHSEAHPFDSRLLKQACEGANIKIIDGVVSREEVNSLMNAADCYVSLHRSEGFGLTLAEAMSLGKPVIATGYSGNMEFMTPANSYLVKYDVVDIDKQYGPYQEGQWAEPDLDHAAELMRFTFRNRMAAAEVGKRARMDILRTLNPQKTGAVMRDRLLRLAELGKIPAPAEDSIESSQPKPKNDVFYHRLVERIRYAVETNVNVNARVIVISKGDDRLVTFSGRKGWHFPQDDEGRFPGYYPGNDSEVIGHLEVLRDRGGEYLVIPQTAFWWLDHYVELRSHLESRYRRIWSNPDCVIYGLTQKNNGMISRFRERVARLSEK